MQQFYTTSLGLHFSEARPQMETGGQAEPRRSSRRAPADGSPAVSLLSAKERGLRAAKDVVEGRLTQTEAAQEWGLSERMVHYYKAQLRSAGWDSESVNYPETPESDAVSVASTLSRKSKAWDDYCAAYMMAGALVAGGKVSVRTAAAMATEKYGVQITKSTAARAALANGERPAKPGRMLIIPREVEHKLEDL